MTERQNYRYVQFQTPTGRGYACVSFTWERQGDVIKYVAGIAFCSPLDAFSKSLARSSAERRRVGSDRVKSKNKRVVSEVSSPNPKTTFITNEEFFAIFGDILKNVGSKNEVPKWALDSWNTNVVTFGLSESVIGPVSV